MNRIYKVIWSKVKHQYVVVSELAHLDGKRSSTVGRSAAAMLAALILTAGVGLMPVGAANSDYGDNNIFITDDIIISDRNEVQGDNNYIGGSNNHLIGSTDNNVIFGNGGWFSTSSNNVYVGNANGSGGNQNMNYVQDSAAFGDSIYIHGGPTPESGSTVVPTTDTLVIGNNVTLDSTDKSLILGDNNHVGKADNTLVIGDNVEIVSGKDGNARLDSTTVIGNDVHIGSFRDGGEQDGISEADNVTVIGDHVNVDNTTNNTNSSNSLIYGNYVDITNSQNSVAMGNNIAITGTGTEEDDNVAIGHTINLGQSGNGYSTGTVAMGDNINVNGTDNVVIGGDINLSGTREEVVVLGHNANTTGNQSVAIGESSSSGMAGVAVGGEAVAAGNAAAFGFQAVANAAETTVVGPYSTVNSSYSAALGDHVTIGGNSLGSVAIGGHSSIADNANYAIAIGGSGGGYSESVTTVGKGATAAIAMGYGATIGENSIDSIALGSNANVNGLSSVVTGSTMSGIAIGKNTNVEGQYSIALGYGAEILGNYTNASSSVAIGESASVDRSSRAVAIGMDNEIQQGASGSTVIGNKSTVGTWATYGVAIGEETTIGNNTSSAIALGHSASIGQEGDYSIALGNSASIGDSTKWSIAMGNQSSVADGLQTATAIGGYQAKVNAYGGTALGSYTQVDSAYSTAVGYNSKVTADDIFTADDLADFKDALGANYTESYNIKASDISKAGVFSVGSKDSERRIINVARGRISEDSTDAVNGSQLYGLASDLNQKIEKAGGDWTLTTNGGPNDTEKTTVGKGDVVDFSGAKDETTQHQNIQISQEQTTDAEGNVTGTKVAVDLNDRVELGTGDDQIVIDATADAGNLFIGKNIQMNASGSATFGGIKLNQDQDVNDNPEHGSTITGLTNKTWNQNGTYNAGRAATEEQLQAAIGNVTANTYQGWNVTTNGIAESSKTISSNNTVDFAGKVDESGHSNIVVSKEDTKDGTNLKFDLNDKVLLGEDEENQIILDGTKGNVSIGDVSVNNGTGISFMADGSATFGKIQINKEEKGSTIIGLTNTTWTPNGTYNAGRAATEEQLQQAINHSEMNFQQNDQHLVKNPGTQDGHYFVDGKNQVNLQVQNGVDENGNAKYDTVTIDNVAQASDVGDVGKFHDDVKNQDGSHTTVVDAINNIDTRVDQVEVDIDNLGDRIDGVEATAGKHSSVSNTDGNITVDGTGTNEAGGVDYVVGLNNDKITVGDETNNVTIEGTKGSITVTNSVSAGQTTISDEGVSVGGNTYITDKGINANNQVITNVAAGKDDTDAVNVSQLKGVEQRVENNSMAITNIGNKVGELDSRIDEVGAGAAALAALHPLDFDPDDKWDFSAGYGNYRGENAVAIGAFYRPNEDTMFSVGGTVGNGDNMVNAGVSFKLGQGNNVSTSRVAMAKEIKSMRDIVAKQDAQIQKLTAMVNALVGMEAIAPDTTTMFPDVPENHWAYEAVETMAKTGLVKGYPDGEFKGDRNMTRYEFAQIVYNAIQAGIKVDERLVQEFRPELEYFRIDTISKDRDGNPVIQRVRANEIPATK